MKLHLLIALFCALGVSMSLAGTRFQRALEPSPYQGGDILALGVGPEGTFQVAVVGEAGLGDKARVLDYALSDQDLQRLEQQPEVGPDITARAEVLERHRSRGTQSIKLTVGLTDRILVSVYEGGPSQVIPKKNGGLPRRAYSSILWSSVLTGLAVGVALLLLLQAVTWLASRSRSREEFPS